MRRLASNVKRLALAEGIWHRGTMAKQRGTNTNDNKDDRAERLRAALRANLRRRKAQPDRLPDGEPSSPKSTG
ncbi:MAG: hypothetical protein IBJ12_05330 [Sphingomonadaceae bacterium]|nr:hypothetical protein [Sphingomonadaceae bacterium]